MCLWPSGLKFSISLEIFNLDWKLQSWPSEFHIKKRVLVGGSLEMFNLAWKFQSRRAILKIFNLWALRGVYDNLLAWPPLQSLAVNFFFFVQILGGEKLLEFVEKCRWNIFKRPERGYKFFKRVSDHFSDPFSRFSNRFSYRFKSFSGAVSFCRHAALTIYDILWHFTTCFGRGEVGA